MKVQEGVGKIQNTFGDIRDIVFT